MRSNSVGKRSATRFISAATGAAIGLGAGSVWLHFSMLECLVCGALGAYVGWTCSGERREEAPPGRPPESAYPPVIAETLPLLPMLSWPAPFPIETTSPDPCAPTPSTRPLATRCAAHRPRHARLGRRVARTRLIQHCRSF